MMEKKITIVYVIFLLIVVYACQKPEVITEPVIYTNGYNEIDIGTHATEGGILKLSNGKILVIYRKDTSCAHISNYSKIVSKTSDDNGKTWNEEKDIYNSVYDDRNLIVGNLGSNDLIIVFRRFITTSTGYETKDSGYILSEDNGETWSTYHVLSGTEKLSNQPFGEIITKNGTSYFLICFEGGLTKKYISENNFHTPPTEQIILNADLSKELVEPYCMTIGGGKSILLYRNDSNKENQNSYYQYVSNDGINYKDMGTTNIFSDFGSSIRSPVSLRYDHKNNELEVCSVSRVFDHTEENYYNELRVYRQNADHVFENSQAYNLRFSMKRPLVSKHWFYGYPKSVRLNDYEVLYMVTDSRKKDESLIPLSHITNEQANLYSFILKGK